MNNQMTKRQHYVPQFYLNNFINENQKLNVYDRKKKCFFEASPKEICFENYLHETFWEDANPKLGKYVLPNQIEKNLSIQESTYSAILKKVIEICKEPKNKHALICNQEDKQLLAKFITNMIVRNPWVLHQVDEDCFSDGIMDNVEVRAIDQMLYEMQFGGTKSLVRAANKMVWLDEKFIPGQISEDFQCLNLCFLIALDNNFVTSSFPVLYETYDLEEHTYLDNIYIPLHPQIALLYSRADKFKPFRNKEAFLTSDMVQLMNSAYFKCKDEQARFIIANSKIILEKLVNNNK